MASVRAGSSRLGSYGEVYLFSDGDLNYPITVSPPRGTMFVTHGQWLVFDDEVHPYGALW